MSANQLLIRLIKSNKNLIIIMLTFLIDIGIVGSFLIRSIGWLLGTVLLIILSYGAFSLIRNFAMRGYLVGALDTIDNFKGILSDSVDTILHEEEEKSEVVNVILQGVPASARLGTAPAQIIAPNGIKTQESFGIPTITQDLPVIHGEQYVTITQLTNIIAQLKDEVLQNRYPMINVRKPGRPTYDDDIWAKGELQKGRAKSDVKKEWLERPGVIARGLVAPDKHFDRIARQMRIGKKQNSD